MPGPLLLPLLVATVASAAPSDNPIFDHLERRAGPEALHIGTVEATIAPGVGVVDVHGLEYLRFADSTVVLCTDTEPVEGPGTVLSTTRDEDQRRQTRRRRRKRFGEDPPPEVWLMTSPNGRDEVRGSCHLMGRTGVLFVVDYHLRVDPEHDDYRLMPGFVADSPTLPGPPWRGLQPLDWF